MTREVRILPLRSLQARSIYEGLPLEDVEFKVEDRIEVMEYEGREALRNAEKAKRALHTWDVDTLVDVGVMTKQDLRHLSDAYEASQAGDEDKMLQSIAEVAERD